MAYNKRLLLTDVFPNADYNAGTSTLEIPLSDLTAGGLDSAEASAEDLRKVLMALMAVTRDVQATILANYTTSIGRADYIEGADYAVGDKIYYNNLEYEAVNAITSAPAIFNATDWQENDLLQPCDNFLATSGSAFFNTAGNEGTQRFQLDVTYSNEFDIKDEA